MKAKKLTEKELAESYVFPDIRQKKEREKEDRDFMKLRMERLISKTAEQQTYASILELKYKLEDYISSPNYTQSYTFGYFLNEYIRIIHMKQKDFANAISLDPTYLNRIIKNSQEANQKILYRLEFHSNQLIPAITWWKLIEKAMEFALLSNKELKTAEYAQVKSKLDLGF